MYCTTHGRFNCPAPACERERVHLGVNRMPGADPYDVYPTTRPSTYLPPGGELEIDDEDAPEV